MILDAFDAQTTGAFNAPKNIKNGQELEELSPKNLGVSIKLFYTVYYTNPRGNNIYILYKILGTIITVYIIF